MQNQIKPRTVSSLFKARYLVGLWVCAELLTLPAAAQVVHSVAFSVEPHVVAAPVGGERPGQRSFVVSSNAPFNVTAANMVGAVDVSVQQSGAVGAMVFGAASQLPGAAAGCAVLTSPAESVIYRAHQRTAARRGDGVEQAVIMTFTFDPIAVPDIRFTVDDRPVSAAACGASA